MSEGAKRTLAEQLRIPAVVVSATADEPRGTVVVVELQRWRDDAPRAR
jgi:hypothetical protein